MNHFSKPSQKKSPEEIIEIIGRIIWYGLIYPRLMRLSQSNQKIDHSEIRQLHFQAERIKGELTILEPELESLPYIEGTIGERSVTDSRDPTITRKYYRLRWYEEGIRKEKHLVQEKKKDGQLTIEEAKTLIANATEAKELKEKIKERKRELRIIQGKLTTLTREPIDLLQAQPKSSPRINSLIGRENESAKLENNLLHNISTLIIGEPGTGKTFLVRSVLENQGRQVIWIDDLRALRNVLIENVIKLLFKHGDFKLDEKAADFEEVKKQLKNKSVAQLCDLIRDSLFGTDYIIVIDSLTGLTPTNKVLLDKLCETRLPIVTCIHKKKSTIDLESIYRRFSVLELRPLSDGLMKEIIKQRIQHINLGKLSLFLETKILNAAVGNPGIADQMIRDAEALASFSGRVNIEQIRSIHEPEIGRKYFDLTPAVVFGIAMFGIMRFIGHGMNDPIMYIVGGCLFIVTMALSRVMMRAWSE